MGWGVGGGALEWCVCMYVCVCVCARHVCATSYSHTHHKSAPTTHVEEGVERERAEGEALHGARAAPEGHVVLDGQHVEEHVQARHLGRVGACLREVSRLGRAELVTNIIPAPSTSPTYNEGDGQEDGVRLDQHALDRVGLPLPRHAPLPLRLEGRVHLQLFIFGGGGRCVYVCMGWWYIGITYDLEKKHRPCVWRVVCIDQHFASNNIHTLIQAPPPSHPNPHQHNTKPKTDLDLPLEEPDGGVRQRQRQGLGHAGVAIEREEVFLEEPELGGVDDRPQPPVLRVDLHLFFWGKGEG